MHRRTEERIARIAVCTQSGDWFMRDQKGQLQPSTRAEVRTEQKALRKKGRPRHSVGGDPHR